MANKIRLVTENLVDNSTLTTSPVLDSESNLENIKSPTRSSTLKTAAYGLGSFNFPTAQGGNNPDSMYTAPDETRLYILDGSVIYQYDFQIAESLPSLQYVTSKDISTNSPGAGAIFLKTDGSVLYIVDNINNEVHIYDLSSAWDISTAIYNAAKDFNYTANVNSGYGIYLKSDGTKMYIADQTAANIVEYSITSWDTSTAVHSYTLDVDAVTPATNTFSVTFDPTGDTTYILGDSNIIYQFNLGTNWDLSSASYADLNADLSYLDITGTKVLVSSLNANRLYYLGRNTDTAYQLEMTISKSIDTLVYNSDSQTIFLRVGTAKSISAVIFGRHTFTKDTTINIYFYDDFAFTNEVYASPTLIVTAEEAGSTKVNWGDFLWDEIGFVWNQDLAVTEFQQANNYVHWIIPTIPNVATIKIVIGNITANEIEFSRLIIGEFIEPSYNISYGYNVSWKESTKQYRASSGATLRSSFNFPYRELEFELKTINSTDRKTISDSMSNVGLRKDFFISLFPEDTDINKLLDYSGIFKLSKISSILEYMPSYYKSKYTMEEV